MLGLILGLLWELGRERGVYFVFWVGGHGVVWPSCRRRWCDTASFLTPTSDRDFLDDVNALPAAAEEVVELGAKRQSLSLWRLFADDAVGTHLGISFEDDGFSNVFLVALSTSIGHSTVVRRDNSKVVEQRAGACVAQVVDDQEEDGIGLLLELNDWRIKRL
jgi:hypothetical protein